MTRSGIPAYGDFAPRERDEMQQAIDAVCDELGVTPRERIRREAIARGVVAAYSHGRRLPLNLVDAGLSAGA